MKQRPCECVDPIVRKFDSMDEPNEYCERCDRWLRKTLNKAKRRAAIENTNAPRAVEE